MASSASPRVPFSPLGCTKRHGPRLSVQQLYNDPLITGRDTVDTAILSHLQTPELNYLDVFP